MMQMMMVVVIVMRMMMMMVDTVDRVIRDGLVMIGRV
jgi:hypothetical protein